ncbi:MAG: Kae1-associated serine/threonine protein kinase [Asgard group archaeon]|nr:Kae1-associated serine/threonine protein kinase [Asgard group archaeon]
MKFESFRGAESKLYQKKWFDFEALFKVRLPKKYRIQELDAYFRKQRTIYEARLLARAKDAGVRVPIIYEIDLANATIVMEFIQGEILKTYFQKVNKNSREDICLQIGRDIGLLHKSGIIHGDLTTSNIIKVKNSNQIAFIDFGLGYTSDKIEDFGIDLYLLERAIRNTHPDFSALAWEMVLKGYKEISPNKEKIEEKLEEINSRGRYSERV